MIKHGTAVMKNNAAHTPHVALKPSPNCFVNNSATRIVTMVPK
jgi:hypothetical protein